MFPTRPSTPSLPTPPPPPPKPAPKEPELQVAPSRGEFKLDAGGVKDLTTEIVRVVNGPGDALNLVSGKRLSDVRSKLDLNVPYQGVHAQKGQPVTVQDVPNPDSPDGKWDPKQFMPHFVFDKAEDAFPVAPDFDGNTTTTDSDDTYKDGVIGGNQGLSTAFTVTKKGEYTVLTYSMYMAHNKAGHYHNSDYATAQVYLKPGPDGKLAPTHLSTSWHHGSVATKYDEMKLDDQGRPVVKVNLGSHALEVMDKDAEIPQEGLHIDGNGQAVLNGEPTGHEVTFDALQTNVKDARYLDPHSEAAKPRLEAMRWGEAAMNPFLPEVYEDAPPVWQEALERGVDTVEGAVEDVEEKVEDVVSDGVDKVVGVADDAKDAVVGAADDAKDTVVGVADDAKDTAEKAWGEIKGLLG